MKTFIFDCGCSITMDLPDNQITEVHLCNAHLLLLTGCQSIHELAVKIAQTNIDDPDHIKPMGLDLSNG